jgi:SAM-dependent methyltransferase
MTEPSKQKGYEDYYLRANPSTKKDYDRKARGYDRKIGPILRLRRPKICLDLGCGSGLFSHYLKQAGVEIVVGVDMNEPLLQVARQNVSAEFVRADATQYAAGCGRTFDAIFLLNILEHIPREKVVQFLSDTKRCLNPGGWALVRAPNINCLGGAAHFCDDFTHVSPFTDASLEQAAREAGFDGVEFCNQFAMQKFKGKCMACLNWLVHRMVFALRGGRMPRVFHRNLYAILVTGPGR